MPRGLNLKPMLKIRTKNPQISRNLNPSIQKVKYPVCRSRLETRTKNGLSYLSETNVDKSALFC